MRYTLITVILILILAVSTGHPLNDADLVINLSFNNAANLAEDSSKNGRDGVLGDRPKAADGKSGGGFLQEGGSYIDLPVKLGEEGTISVWFNANWTGGDDKTYRIFDATLGGKYFFIGAGAENNTFPRNQIGFYIEDAPDRHWHSVFDVKEVKIQAGQWYHLAATWVFDGGIAAFYLDGQLAVTTDITANPLGPPPELNPTSRLGLNLTDYMPAAEGANGTIDELRIYRKAAGEGDISALMDAGLAVEAFAKLTTTWGQLKTASP